MKQRKKLDLKELELQLPPIESNETRIILGGNDYSDGYNLNPDDPSLHDGKEWEYDEGMHFYKVAADGGGQNDDIDAGDLDHYYDYDYDDGYPADGNVDYSHGLPSVSPFHVPNGLSDGMNLAQPNINMDPLIDNGVQDVSIMAQVQGILSSNSVIKGLLGFYNNGYLNLTIGSDVIPIGPNGEQTGAHTGIDGSDPNWSTVFIALNELGFNQDGWQWDWSGTDNMGFDHSSLNTIEELVAILAHESIHAKHDADFLNAFHENGKNLADTRNWMISHGYNSDYINAWFTVDANGVVGFNPNHTAAVHTYMQTHDQGIIQQAIDEFRQDMHNLQQTVDNIRQERDFAWLEGHSSGASVPSESWPSPAEWMAYYDKLQSQLNEIMSDWGSFIDKGF